MLISPHGTPRSKPLDDHTDLLIGLILLMDHVLQKALCDIGLQV